LKIAFVSDFHLGYNEDSLQQAANALLKAAEQADLIVVAGDLFDSRVPKQETVLEAVTLLNDCLKKMGRNIGMSLVAEDGREKEIASVPLIAIYGTHERRSKGLVNIIQVLASAGLVVNAHAAKIVVEKNGERVAVQGMGGMPEEYAKRALEYLDLKPVEGAFNIFVFHQNLKELIPVAEGLSASDLPEGFDLYVDGHVHNAEQLKVEGKRILVPGSTVVTQMKKNETAQKGFFLFDSRKYEADFVEISSRPFVFEELSFENADIAEVEAKARSLLHRIAAQYKSEKPLVKIKLGGSLAPGLTGTAIELKELEEEFKEKMLLNIEKEFGLEELRERIEFVKRMLSEKKSSREIGVEILRRKLSEKNAAIGAEEAEELLELLSEGKTEQAMQKLS
jgi:DNA repair exonuclease SbcCD nuclease subunit